MPRWSKAFQEEKIRVAKFALFGVINTGVDFAVFMLLVYGMGIGTAWAQTVSYGCGVVSSYLLNRRWTFGSAGRGNWAEFMRFAAVNAASFAAATAVLLGLQTGAGLSPVAAKAASILFALIVNYTGNRFWVFRMESRRHRAQ